MSTLHPYFVTVNYRTISTTLLSISSSNGKEKNFLNEVSMIIFLCVFELRSYQRELIYMPMSTFHAYSVANYTTINRSTHA